MKYPNPPPYRCIEHPDGAKTMINSEVTDWGCIDWMCMPSAALVTVAQCVGALIDSSVWETTNTGRFVREVEAVADAATEIDMIPRADFKPAADFLASLSPYQVEIIRYHFAYAIHLMQAESAEALKQVDGPATRLWRLMPKESITVDSEQLLGKKS